MKSEHRHDLAENDLSKLLTRWLQRIEPYSNKILIGALVVTVVIVATVMTMRSSRATRSAGFTELAGCSTPDCYETVAKDFPESVAGSWARLRAAEEYLEEGIRLSVSDGKASEGSLEKSQESFEMVLKGDAPAEVREKALNGLGMCLEAVSDGDTTDAVEAYEQLLSEFPETRYRRWAENRIEQLKTGRVQQFYSWFAQQDPKPEDRPNPFDFPSPFPATDSPLEIIDNPDSDLPPPPPSANRTSDASNESGATEPSTSPGPALSAPPDAGSNDDGETTPQTESEPTSKSAPNP